MPRFAGAAVPVAYCAADSASSAAHVTATVAAEEASTLATHVPVEDIPMDECIAWWHLHCLIENVTSAASSAAASASAVHVADATAAEETAAFVAHIPTVDIQTDAVSSIAWWHLESLMYDYHVADATPVTCATDATNAAIAPDATDATRATDAAFGNCNDKDRVCTECLGCVIQVTALAARTPPLPLAACHPATQPSAIWPSTSTH